MPFKRFGKVALFISVLIGISQLLGIRSFAESPYPIIFVHGIADSALGWTDPNDGNIDQLFLNTSWAGWQVLNVCLNANDSSTETEMFGPNHVVDKESWGDWYWDNTEYIDDDVRPFIDSTLEDQDYYVANFHVDPNGNPYRDSDACLSNQAAIKKQGRGLKYCIEAVLDATGAEKVILLGHSMGGLAAREYIQNQEHWARMEGETNPSHHHVAKLVTTGTPHLGAHENDWIEFAGIPELIAWFSKLDLRSDAARDSNYCYSIYGDCSSMEPSDDDNGVYLFGGNEESILPVYDYYNRDVDCDGDETSTNVIGLTERDMPTDLEYFWIVGQHTGGQFAQTDGVVRCDRQLLNNGECIVRYDTWHSKSLTAIAPGNFEKGDHESLIIGLDEPDWISTAYKIEVGTYQGFITHQGDRGTSFDVDIFRFSIGVESDVQITLQNLPVDCSLTLLNENGQTLKHIDNSGLTDEVISATIPPGTYFIRVQGTDNQQDVYRPYSLILEVSQNHAASLSSPGVQPPSGDTNTAFQFRVTYTDNNPPDAGSVKLILDSQEYQMTTTDTNYSDGSVFLYPSSGGIQLSQGQHQYYFEATQGGTPVQGSPTSTLSLSVSPPSAGQVTVQLSPSTIEVFATTNITATVKDSAGNPVENVTVNFSRNQFPGLISPTSDQTNNIGQATSTFKPTASGSALITAQVDGGGPSGSAYLTVNYGTITFELQLQPAGSFYELSATLLDNGQTLDYENVTFTLSPTSMAYFLESNDTTLHTYTNSEGNVYADVDVTQYGTLTITATHDSTETTSSITISIQEGGGTAFKAFKNLGYSGADVDWSRNGNLITITGSGGSTVLIQDALGSHSLWRTISLNNVDGGRGVVFSSDSQKIFVAGEGNPEEMAVLTLNYPGGTPSVDSSDNDHGKIEHRSCDWEGSRILTGRTSDPECELYYSNLSSARSIDMPSDANAVAFDKTNSSRFVVGDENGNIKAATTGGSELWNKHLNEDEVASVAWYGDNVVVAGNTGVIFRYSSTGGGPNTFIHGTNRITCLEFSHNGQWLASCGGGGIKIWSTGSWSEMYSGPDATCVAWDPTSTYLVDNSGNLYAPFDDSPPTITVSSPPDGYETFDATVNVIGTITDNLVVSSATISVNGGAGESLTLDSQGAFSHTVTLNQGANTIRIDAPQGAYAEITVTRLVDNIGPVMSNVNTTPTVATIGSVFVISAQVIDAHSSIDTGSVTCHIQLPGETDVQALQMYDDGTHGDVTASDSVYTCEWNSSSATENNYLVDITASDSGGNPSEAENVNIFTVYDVPIFGTPVVAPTSPTDKDEVTIGVDIADSSGISSKTVWYQAPGSTTWLPRGMTGAGPIYSGIIPMLNDGTVRYKIEATDGLGHTSQSATYQYTVTDASPPVAWNWSRSPSDITELTTGTVVVSVKVVDVGGSGLVGNPQMDYRLSDGIFDGWEGMMAAGGDLWTFVIPDLGWAASEGKSLQYKVRAVDNRGNELITPIQTELIDEVSAPTISTTVVSSITFNSASSGGNVTSDGGAPVTARGVCWSTSANPTTSDSHTSDGTGTGSFTSSITGLSPGTTYHVRAYATNSVGTGYGSDLTFTTRPRTLTGVLLLLLHDSAIGQE